MKRIFQGFKLSSFIASMIIGLTYPIIKTTISDNKLLVFSDSCMIIGLLFVLFGIFNSLYLHGDFDITTYIAKRAFTKEKKETYEQYKDNLQEKRKSSFNYPLYTGIILILLSFITSLFC